MLREKKSLLLPKKRILFFLLGGIAVVLLAGGLIWVMLPSHNSPVDSSSISNCVSISRGSYGISPSVFELLPPPPKCFYSVVAPYQQGTFTQPFFFDESYYLQPEFFPAFEKEGLNAWKNPTAGFWGAVGYGAHPYALSLALHPGETTRTRFFLFSSFGIRTHQGMRIEPFFPNPVDAQHVSVKLISDDVSEGFILGPSFPKFDPDWVHPIEVEVTAQPNIPAETLRVFFRIKSPSLSVDETGVKAFGSNYYSATAYVGERDPAILTVQIVPLEKE